MPWNASGLNKMYTRRANASLVEPEQLNLFAALRAAMPFGGRMEGILQSDENIGDSMVIRGVPATVMSRDTLHAGLA
jgi:hypothetical protein